MSEVIGYVFGIILFGLFLYFGYKDDYKRDPKAFVKTIATLFLGLLTFVLIMQISKMTNLKNDNTTTPQHINTTTQKE